MENNNFDILKDLQEFDDSLEIKNKDFLQEKIIEQTKIEDLDILSEEFAEDIKETTTSFVYEESIEEKSIIKKGLNLIAFLLKYVLTSSLIFGLLLLTTNYQAYFNIVKAGMNSQGMEKTKESLVASVEAMNLSEKKDEIESKEIKKDDKIVNNSFKSLSDTKKEDLSLNIDITPYENRIIIPSIGKNIPLVDIKNRTVKGQSELNDIFMQELEKGVIRYPGSAKPGEIGNSFIFGHSSNFPWIKGEYNDVFALLNNIKHNDEIIIYYNQKKYVYKINNKLIIKPGNVSVLKSDDKKKKLSIMTCRPIGTTLNRLVISGDLVDEKNLVK